MLKKRDYSVRQVQILFLVFHMIMVAYAVMFLHPYYGSNDEFTLAAIASGAYGSYTWYFIYLHSAFAWILRFFYPCPPLAVPGSEDQSGSAVLWQYCWCWRL